VEKARPIYFLTAQEYGRLEDVVAQLAGILDLVYEKGFQDIEADEELPMN